MDKGAAGGCQGKARGGFVAALMLLFQVNAMVIIMSHAQVFERMCQGAKAGCLTLWSAPSPLLVY